jgi:hypothetical protein
MRNTISGLSTTAGIHGMVPAATPTKMSKMGKGKRVLSEMTAKKVVRVSKTMMISKFSMQQFRANPINNQACSPLPVAQRSLRFCLPKTKKHFTLAPSTNQLAMPDQDEFDDNEWENREDGGEENGSDDADARFWQELNDLDWSSSEEDEDLGPEVNDQTERLAQLPLMKKAREILHLTEAIAAAIDDRNDIFQICARMLENAMQIGAKVVRAEASKYYSVKMENAVLVKVNANELLSQLGLCEQEELISKQDGTLLHDEVMEFRQLFVDWVGKFDKKTDQPDEWGLFAPPH